MESSVIWDILLKLSILLFAVSLHEVGHGWMAYRLGDPTAKMLGRLTLDPRKHIDPVGSVLVPGALLLMGGPVFGWAKPVPITKENLSSPRRDDFLISFMGPAMNILLFFVGWAALFFLSQGGWLEGSAGGILSYFFSYWILLNLVLAFFNLLPIPPLDGSWIVQALLPPGAAYRFSKIAPYGFLILLLLLYTGALNPFWRFVSALYGAAMQSALL